MTMDEQFVEVEGPDGSIYEFPAGTTQEVALEFFKRQQPAPVAKVESPSGFKKGVSDPYQAVSQAASKYLPKGLLETVEGVKGLTPAGMLSNLLPDRIKSAIEDIAPAATPTSAQEIANKEKLYVEQRKLAGETGVDWSRMAGNVLSPINLVTGAVAAPLKLAGRLAVGTGQGAISQPLESTDDFSENKARQAGLGTLGAVGGELVGRTLGRVVSPSASRDPQIQALMGEGITPTMGHLLGPKSTSVERALHITPILGTAIGRAETRAFEDFNRAVANRIARKVGEKLPKDVDVGTDLFAKTNELISSKYDSLLPKMKGAIDAPFRQELDTIKSMAKSLPPEQEATLNRILQHDLEDRFTSSGLASGETLKTIEGLIGKRARDYSKSLDPDQRQIGNALFEVRSSLHDMMLRQNPKEANQLQKINDAWASLVRMEKATLASGAQKRGGMFTPEEYLGAIKSSDSSLRKRNVAKGTALDQDFAQAAQRVLGKDQQGLGQAYRTAGALGFGGAYMAKPQILGAEVAAALPYTPMGQKAVATALGRRPEIAAGIRQAIKSSVPLTYAAVNSPLQQIRDVNPEQLYRRPTEE